MNQSAVARDNVVDGCEAQSASLAGLLGCKKRFEYSLARRVVHAVPVVAHHKKRAGQ